MIPDVKCAIYTRKSHEKGLEQTFNALDAQREACLAYIASQKSQGWIPIEQSYNDGGCSGGTIDRPALQQLIEDIKALKVNIVVVYKIDRLTRALADFARLIEIFDQYKVSFVSVTQSFNTTTSMGRLTLNVLLSFAQFEREIIGERIRDKIAASKKKGMWMGGYSPLGYDIKEQKLHANKQEAETVRYIFDSYLELKSILRLKDHLNTQGIQSKGYTSNNCQHKGRPYSNSGLYHLLSNPIYIGYIRHRNDKYKGSHKAIISMEKWEQVQNILADGRAKHRDRRQRFKYPLKGKIFDIDGVIYKPMRSKKGEKYTYYYYISQNWDQNRDTLKSIIGRLPACEIQSLVYNTIVKDLKLIQKLSDILKLNIKHHYKTLEGILKNIETDDLYDAIEKIIVDLDSLTIITCLEKLVVVICRKLRIDLPAPIIDTHNVTIPYYTKRARSGAVIIQEIDKDNDFLNLPLNKLEILVKGIIWRDEHFKGRQLDEIAKENNCSHSYVMRVIKQSLNPL